MGASMAQHPSGFEDRYELLEKLGTGSFGEVHAAVSINRVNPAGAAVAPTKQRAVKIISLAPKRARPKDDGTATANIDVGVLKAAKEEARLWRKVGKHPHCIELLRTFSQDGLFMMVAEKADASVMERLRHVRQLPTEGLLRIVREMLLGVAHCHKRRVVHRDIKPDNFLLSGEGGTVKLCDFGLAARLPLSGGQLFGTHGTAPYMSVEMILNSGHDASTDVWSLGVTTYILQYGDFPYRPKTVSNGAMKQAVVTGLPRPSFRSRSSGAGCDPWQAQQLVDVTKRMMERESYKRCTCAEALALLPTCAVRKPSTCSSVTSSGDSACPCSP